MKGSQRKDGYNRSVKVSKKDIIMITLTLINCSIGPGMMSLPKVMSTVGLLPAYIFLIVATLYAFFFAHEVTNADYHGNFDTLPDLMRSIWGKKWAMVLDVSLVCCNTGFLVSYVTVSSDYIRSFIVYFGKTALLNSESWKKIFKVIVSAVIFVPLSLLKTIDAISNLTAFSFVFSLVAVIMINVRFFQFVATGKISGQERSFIGEGENVFDKYFGPMPGRIPALFSYFYTFFILYTVHASLTPMQREFGAKKGKKNGDQNQGSGISTPSQRMKTLSKGFTISTLIVMIIYIIVGTEGALLFDRTCTNTDGTPKDKCVLITSNILLAFGNDTAVMIIMLLYSIVVIVGFPCLLYPVRTSVCKWLKVDRWNGRGQGKLSKEEKAEIKRQKKERKERKKRGEDEIDGESEIQKLPFTVRQGYFVYCLIGLAVIVLTCILSIFVPEIDKMISLISNIFGVFIFEISAIFIFYKRSIIRKYSIGKSIDKAMNEWRIVKTIEDLNLPKNSEEKTVSDDGSLILVPEHPVAKNSIFIHHPDVSVSGKGSTKGKKHGSVVAGLKRFGDFRRSSLVDTESIKNHYSFYLGDKKTSGSSRASKGGAAGVVGIVDIGVGTPIHKPAASGKSPNSEVGGSGDVVGAGRRTWSEEETESDVCDEIEMPKIDTESGTTSYSTTRSTTSTDTDGGAEKDKVIRPSKSDTGGSVSMSSKEATARKMRNSMKIVERDNIRSKSLIIVNEGIAGKDRGSVDANCVDAVFPDVSHIDASKFHKDPKGSKAFVLVSSIFFVVLALTATACDIYGWVAY